MSKKGEFMAIRNRYESILESFKNDYTRWYNRMVDWYGNGDYEIVAILDDRSKLIYNQATGTMRFLRNEGAEISEEDWIKDFSMTLKHKVSMSGLTQQDLSNATGISKVSISKYMAGKSVPSHYNMLKIARALNCSVYEFTHY